MATMRVEHLLEAVPDALVGMNQKGVIRFVNHQTELLFGYDRDQLIGEPVEMIVLEPLWQIYAEHHDYYFADPRTRSSGLDVELVGQHQSGRLFPVNVSLSHIDTGDVLLVITAADDVAKQKDAVRNAELITATVEYSEDAIIATTSEGVITSWNPSAERIYGYSSREIMGRSIKLLVPEGQAGEFSATLDIAKRGEHIEPRETVRVRKDGSVVPVSVTVAPLRDEGGRIVGTSAVHRDVTEQRRAFEVAQRLAAIVQSSDDAIISRTMEGIITSWNQAAEKMYGYTSQEIIGQPVDTLIPEDRRAEAAAATARIRSGEHVDHLETIRIRRDGTRFPAAIRMSPIHDPDGAIVGVSAIHRDVTKQRRAFEVAQYMKAIVEGSDDAVISRTIEGIITSWNPAAESMYGYTSQEIIGQSIDRLVPEGAMAQTRAVLARLKEGQTVERLETIRVRKDGMLVPVSVTVSPIRDPDGKIVGAAGIHRDVTEQRRAFEVAQRLAAIVESSDDAIIGRTLDGIITSWNPAAERMYGYTSEEMVGQTNNRLIPDDRESRLSSVVARIRAGEHVERLETTYLRRDGTVVPVSAAISPIRDVDGEFVGVSAVHRDVTEQRRAFDVAQQMAAIVASSVDAIVGQTLKGIITSWNPAAERIYGHSSQEIVGQPISVLMPEDRTYEMDNILARIGAGERVERLETVRVRKDGTAFPVSLTISPIRDPHGAIVGAAGIAHDLTEQEHAARYARSLIEAGLDPLVTISPEGKVTDVNEATVRITGVCRKELIGSDYAQYVTEPNKAREAFQRALEQGSVADFPLTVRHLDGTLTDVISNASVYRDLNAEVIGVLVTGHDVTRRKKEFETAQRMAAIVENSADAIIGGDLQRVITSWNPAAERMYGYTSKETVGRSIEFMIPQDRVVEADVVLAKVRAGQEVEGLETTRIRKDGTTIPVSLTFSPLRDAEGTIIGSSVFHRDLTEHQHAAQYARSLIEAGLDPLVTISPEGKIRDLNDATVRITGHGREDLIGTDFSQHFTDPERAHLGCQRALAQGSVTEYPLTLRRRDGSLTDVLCNVSVYRDTTGRALGVIAAARDLTKQKQVFEAVQRMAAIVEHSDEANVSSSLNGPITSWNLGRRLNWNFGRRSNRRSSSGEEP